LGQDGSLLLYARRDAQSLLGVVDPKVLVRYAGFQEVALGSLSLLRILNSESRPVRHGAGFHRLRSFADAEVASQLQFCSLALDDQRRHLLAELRRVFLILPRH
jgi:hypothetical protein